jgi:transposase
MYDFVRSARFPRPYDSYIRQPFALHPYPRLHSEAAFAHLCGVDPIPASSGKTTRHRLNPGGDRQANSALHRIAIVRLRYCERTQKYAKRRIAEGHSKREILRCLKRYIAREVYRTLRADLALPAAA